MGKIADYFGRPQASFIIGDKLQQPTFYVTDGAGNVQSFTGYTLTSKLFDQVGNVVAMPTVTVSDSNPFGTGTVVDSLIAVSEIPSNLPSKQGLYKLQILKTLDSDNDDITTVLIENIEFMQPYAL